MAKKTTSKPAKKATRGSAPRSVALITRTAQQAVVRNAQKGRDALALIERKSELIAEAFYDVALALQVLRRKEIYAALGARSFAELVETRTRLSRSMAFELVKIPAHLSRETAVKLGSQQSIALIALTDATPEDDDPEALARQDATIDGTPLSQQSVRSLEAAAKKARPASKRRNDPAADAARSAAHDLEARLEKTARQDLVVVPTRKKDGWWVKLELPIESAKRLQLGPAKR